MFYAHFNFAATVSTLVAPRHYITIAQVRAACPTPAPAATIAAELRRAGFVPGFALIRVPRADLLVYENWLHRILRDWCFARPYLTAEQFAAAHPEVPRCPATHREIIGDLGRLGYARAYVRGSPFSPPGGGTPI